MSREYRRLDGIGNNAEHPERGAAGQRLLRSTPVHYADRASSLARSSADDPSPRAISNAVHREDPTGKKPNPAGGSDYLWAWGQFLDHEIDLTEGAEGEDEHLASPIPEGDPQFDPTQFIETQRSIFDESTGGGTGNPRQQINEISSYIDATNVYGSNQARSTALRLLDGSGKLETSDGDAHGDLLPRNIFGLPNAMPGQRFFLAGDIRANEHAVLTSLHTLWVREHNRLCDLLITQSPHLVGNDEELFQRARQLVIGMMQAITYNEFLPALLGPDAIDRQRKYAPGEDAGVDTLFSTAAYRLGHSMLSSDLMLEDGSTMPLKDAFFDPDLVRTRGIEVFLGGLARQRMQTIDRFAVEDVRSFLFANVQARPLDLAALNILRGRDHGLPDYNTCRRSLGLSAAHSFADVSSDPDTQAALASVYPSVDHIDPWTGGLCEDQYGAGMVGEFFTAVLVDQFSRFRTGDRLFYEWNPNLSTQERLFVHQTRLGAVLRRNTSLTPQKNVFFVEEEAGPEFPDIEGLASGDGGDLDGPEPPLSQTARAS